MRRASGSRTILLTLGLALPQASPALSTDSQQPIYIEADRVEVDDSKGVSTYHGGVELTQGSMRLLADQLTVLTEGQDVKQVTAVGKPARFSQKPDKGDEIIATAAKMDYEAARKRILLLDGAQLQQGQNTFRSPRIEYDIQREAVIASGGGKGPQGRVHIVIEPRKKDAAPGKESKSP